MSFRTIQPVLTADGCCRAGAKTARNPRRINGLQTTILESIAYTEKQV
jgi:hypothetical protein